MISVIIVSLLLLQSQDSFTQFSYCRQNVRGPFETQCVQLGPDGAGEVRFKRREAEEVQSAVALSPASKDRFIQALNGTKFLANASKYESNRKVADLGRKVLTLEMPSGQRQAEFNYSELKEVTALVQFFEGLLNQETLVFDLSMALQFERLSVPERLEQMERELKANRVSDPRGLMPVLEKVEKDSRLVNYARTHARRLLAELAEGK